MSDVEKIQEVTDAAMKPGTFSIVDAIKERAYPSDDIAVFMDEASSYKAAELSKKLESLEPTTEDYINTQKQLDEVLEFIEKSKYVFTITGISEGKREELYELTLKKFPMEYKEEKNVLTGETKKVEIETPERDSLFTTLLWSAYITKITNPEGAIQENLSPEDADELRKSLPIAVNGIINSAIQNMRAATALFMYKVDEDFLAKS